MFPRLTRLAVGAVALTCFAAPARAQDIKAAAKSVVEKNQKAVVNVKLVVKISIAMGAGGRDEEQKVEVTGTVIDPSGLTVVSAAAIDPAAMLKQIVAMQGGGEEGPKIESEVAETNLVLEDGTEVEADVVLKDPELDLAFVKPRVADKKFDAIALKKGAALGMLDDFFIVSRLDRSANRSVAVTLGRVKAVVKGPKTFALADGEVASTSLGCLAFGADGAPLGIFVSKTSKGGDSEGQMGMMRRLFMGGGGGMSLTVLRPIEDILELAEQAKNAKPPEKKAPKKATKEKKDDDEDEDAPKKPAKKEDGAKKDDGAPPKKDGAKKDE